MIINQNLETRHKTIVHFLNGLHFGGNENLCLQIIKHSSPDVQNVLVNLNSEHLDMLPLFDKIPNLLIVHQNYQRDRRLKFVIELTFLLKRISPQAVLIYAFGIHIFVGLAARLAGVSLIAARAGNPAPQELLIQKKWKAILQISQFLKIPIYSCSSATEKSLETITKLPHGSHPILNGCDVTGISIQANISREKRIANSVKVIGMVARLNKIKDHQTLIKAFNIIYHKFPETELWLVGDGEEKEVLQNLSKQLGLSEKIIFWGNRSDVAELLGQMDIYAFSTTNDEGFGIALIEAMSASLPVIASDVPACREVTGNGEGGILVLPGNPTALAKVLEDFLQFPDKITDWGKRAYHHAVKHHSIEECAQKWYQTLLKE